jgi:hypothetical protein
VDDWADFGKDTPAIWAAREAAVNFGGNENELGEMSETSDFVIVGADWPERSSQRGCRENSRGVMRRLTHVVRRPRATTSPLAIRHG